MAATPLSYTFKQVMLAFMGAQDCIVLPLAREGECRAIGDHGGGSRRQC
jgi:hypothetical protein